MAAEGELETETDPLSMLPREIIDLILCYLPLDEAVRTSALSKRWRHAWKTIPVIEFNYKSFLIADNKEDVQSNKQKFVEAVGQVLENHVGEIQRFAINHPYLTFANPGIDQWMLRLSNSPVTEFGLHLWDKRDSRYEMQASLLECKGLKKLELSHCLLVRFPPTFGDTFKGITTLKLLSTPLSQERFECLVESCPLLTILSYCHAESYFPSLKINAPRLFRFQFDGVFDELEFVHGESLSELSFSMDWSRSDKSRESPPAHSSNLVNFCRCLGNVKALHIETQFLKYLIHGYVPEKLPIAFPNMTTLAVEMDPTCREELDAVLCMLTSFAHLNGLTIVFRGKVEDDREEAANYFVEEKRRHMVWMPDIRWIEVRGFSDRFLELGLMELVLQASPNVEQLWVVDSITSKGRCPVAEMICRVRLTLPREAKATRLRRESCRNINSDLVHAYINGLQLPFIPRHIIQSPPEPQEF